MSKFNEVRVMSAFEGRSKFGRAAVAFAALAVLTLAGCKAPVAPEKTDPAPAPVSVAAPEASPPTTAALPTPPVEPTARVAAGTVVAPPAQSATPRPGEPTSPAVPAAPAAPVVRASTGLPPGAGRDQVQRVCTSCHAIGMVTAKGRTEQEWAEIIGRMQGLGMEASDDDLYAIHDYLTRELPPRR